MSFFEKAEEHALQRESRIREKEMEMELRFKEMEDKREERMLSFFATLMQRPPTTPPSVNYSYPQQQSIPYQHHHFNQANEF